MRAIHLKGGQGNQMFQYAYARAKGQNGPVVLNTYDLEHPAHGDTPRVYALGAFTLASVELICKPRHPLERMFEKVMRRLKRDWGYWQSPKYFEHIREMLLKDFSLARPLSPAATTYRGQLSENAVSLHVRRGDYVSNPKVQKMYGACSLSYYERAIAKINERVATLQWFVFSDDIAWVKENLSLPASTVFVQGTDLSAAEELWLMSRCRHNVIANSSFSWWAAWLNQNPDKMVVAPEPWFDYAPAFTRDIIPDTWIKIPK